MIRKVQSITRAFFRAFVVGMLILNYDTKAVWALPFGLLIGLLSEIEEFTKK